MAIVNGKLMDVTELDDSSSAAIIVDRRQHC